MLAKCYWSMSIHPSQKIIVLQYNPLQSQVCNCTFKNVLSWATDLASLNSCRSKTCLVSLHLILLSLLIQMYECEELGVAYSFSNKLCYFQIMWSKLIKTFFVPSCSLHLLQYFNILISPRLCSQRSTYPMQHMSHQEKQS